MTESPRDRDHHNAKDEEPPISNTRNEEFESIQRRLESALNKVPNLEPSVYEKDRMDTLKWLERAMNLMVSPPEGEQKPDVDYLGDLRLMLTVYVGAIIVKQKIERGIDPYKDLLDAKEGFEFIKGELELVLNEIPEGECDDYKRDRTDTLKWIERARDLTEPQPEGKERELFVELLSNLQEELRVYHESTGHMYSRFLLPFVRLTLTIYVGEIVNEKVKRGIDPLGRENFLDAKEQLESIKSGLESIFNNVPKEWREEVLGVGGSKSTLQFISDAQHWTDNQPEGKEQELLDELLCAFRKKLGDCRSPLDKLFDKHDVALLMGISHFVFFKTLQYQGRLLSEKLNKEVINPFGTSKDQLDVEEGLKSIKDELKSILDEVPEEKKV